MSGVGRLSKKNIYNLLNAGPKNLTAITAPNRPALTYEALIKHVDRIGGQLASQGLTNSDRVAIVLPNGPEMAYCIIFFCETSCAWDYHCPFFEHVASESFDLVLEYTLKLRQFTSLY